MFIVLDGPVDGVGEFDVEALAQKVAQEHLDGRVVLDDEDARP